MEVGQITNTFAEEDKVLVEGAQGENRLNY